MKATTAKNDALSSSTVELERSDVELESDERVLERELFKERLRAVIPKRGEAALAKRAGISPSGLRGALKNGNPGREILVAIARAIGVSVEWLATGQGSRTPGEEPIATVVTFGPKGLWRDEQEHEASRPANGPPGPAFMAGYSSHHPPGDPAPSPPTKSTLPADLPRLAACLEAVQQLPEALDAQRQLTLAYVMIDLIHFLDDQGHQPNHFDRQDLADLARMLNKAVAAP